MSLTDSDERPIPPAIIIGGGLVMAVSLLVVVSARMGVAPRQTRPVAAAVASYDFRVSAPDSTGMETVLSARNGARVGPLAGRGDDFLPSLVDKLHQERRLKGLADTAPFRLVRFSDGRVSMQDPVTGRELNLESFGSVNEANAARLIDEGQAVDAEPPVQQAQGHAPKGAGA